MSSKRQLVEPARELRGPALVQPAQVEGKRVLRPVLHWAASWHMQTPLENLDSGSYLLLEYRAKAGDTAVTASLQYALDRAVIDSGDEELQLVPQTLQQGGASAGGSASGGAVRSTLQVTITLSRKPRDIKLLDVL